MHRESVQHRIACLNQLEEKKQTKETIKNKKKTRKGMGMRKQGKGIKKTDERKQRFDPQ